MPPRARGQRTLGMRLEQKETETPVLYDKKKLKKRHERWKRGEEAKISQSINQSINQEVFVLQNLRDIILF